MLTIRFATKEDVPFLYEMVKELAAFELAPEQVLTTEQSMIADGFGDAPLYKALIAEWEGEKAGMAIYYIAYSTWKGRMIFLDDLYIKPAYRRKKIASALLEKFLEIGKAEKCNLAKWQVLDWNTDAIALYKKYKCIFHSDWIDCKVFFL